MKRSEMVEILKDAINEYQYQDYMFDTQTADKVLKVLEIYGIKPPAMTALEVRGKDWPFGGGCSMRCDCSECNPNYLMYQWEKE